MPAHPKPAPRAKKAPRPIRRKATRRRKHTCISRGCNRIPTAGAMCLTHAKRKADEAWGQRIRNGTCELADIPIRCAGPIQACHGFSRGYMGTRYLLANGFSGCAAHNLYAEIRPLEWDTYLRNRWGQEQYDRLRAIALHPEKVDYEQVIAGLRDKARSEEA